MIWSERKPSHATVTKSYRLASHGVRTYFRAKKFAEWCSLGVLYDEKALHEWLAEIFTSQGAPPVSTTPAVNFAIGTAGVVDTGSKFATDVNDTSGKFSADVNDTGGK